jgi:hypothetical protein
VALGECHHAVLADRGRDDVSFRTKSLARVELGAVAADADAEREHALRMTHAEMQRREAAHRQANDMRLGAPM